MGKRRERDVSEPIVDVEELPAKKSKKHKHKKSSRREEVEKLVNVEDEDVDISVDDVDDSPSLRLKIQIDSSPEKPSTPKSSKMKGDKTKNSGKKSSKKKEGKGEDDTDSEEERWLDAIESGKLEEVDDELKRMKNPRLMTARQRAMLEKRSDGTEDPQAPVIPAEPLLSLPSGFKEKVVTEEMLAKKAIKTQKRREQAQEKREEDKKKTVDRLLKKQDSKVAKVSRHKSSKKEIPMYSYVSSAEGVVLSVPQGYQFPMLPSVKGPEPPMVSCGAPGCSNAKKYSCSKTGVPLCSLQCYNNNLRSNSIVAA